MRNKSSKHLRSCQSHPLQHQYVPVTFNYQEFDNRDNSKSNQNANLNKSRYNSYNEQETAIPKLSDPQVAQ